MKADKNQLAYIGAKPGVPSRDSDSWYTPSLYTDLAREVMGGIDLDPFSSKEANEFVKAKRYFDTKSDAFKQQWFKGKGTVFMNPPYGRTLIQPSTSIFVDNWLNGSISQAVVLVNNATETKWFQQLLKNSAAICLASKRISFTAIDDKSVSGNTRGQVFLYFGPNVGSFNAKFKDVGVVLKV